MAKYIKRYLSICAVIIVALSAFMPRPAQAQCCVPAVTTQLGISWEATVTNIKRHVDREVAAHKKFLEDKLWKDYILPAMEGMTDQLTAVGMQQTGIIGTFFDGKHQLETQRLMQNMQARAHKDYHPSMGMCEFGSNVKSLAASERKAEVSAIVLAKRAIDRQLGAANSSASQGAAQDITARLDQYKDKYCDTQDQGANGLSALCARSDETVAKANRDPGAFRERLNKDIDFVRTVSLPWTIEADFTDSELQDDEEDILALASNLFSHNIYDRPSAKSLIEGDEANMWAQRKTYLNMRSITAKRNVAQNSFNAIVGMKTEGSGGSKEFMTGILEELGIDATSEIPALIGEKPSYHAQMELLTKKIYQNPDFYTNLYDKPANVSRKGVAMQAIGLMQKFDMLKSTLRKEASLSVLLELAVTDEQNDIIRDN